MTANFDEVATKRRHNKTQASVSKNFARRATKKKKEKYDNVADV